MFLVIPPKSTWCYGLQSLNPSSGNLGEDGLGLFLCLRFLAALNAVQFFYTYTKSVILMKMHQKHYIMLNKGTIKYTSNESFYSLIESCCEYKIKGPLARDDNIPLQPGCDPQSNGVHRSVFTTGNSFVAVPCQLDLTSTYEQWQHKPDS